jgi:hypothetical protein
MLRELPQLQDFKNLALSMQDSHIGIVVDEDLISIKMDWYQAACNSHPVSQKSGHV